MNRLGRVFLLCTACTLLSACLASAPAPREPEPEQPFSLVYFCNGSPFSVIFSEEQVRLDLGTRITVLPQIRAASGARYTDGETTFWSKGSEALLDLPGQEPMQCQGVPAQDPWEEAALRGAVLRAIGQEPGWTLEIVPEQWIRLVLDYSAKMVFAPVTEPHPTGTKTLRYATRAEGNDLIIPVTAQACTDIMSGELFPLQIQVEFDDRQLSGCGRTLPE
ncbi:MAG: MliC family protein [Desulfovibrionales bacterium]